MATTATFGDVFVLAAFGKKQARLQRAFMAEYKVLGPAQGAKQNFGRPYCSTTPNVDIQVPGVLRFAARLVSAVVWPIRAIVDLGKYDAAHTR